MKSEGGRRMRGLEVGHNREADPPVDRWGGGAGGSVMTAVCYDVAIQVRFDKTVLSTCVFIASALSPSTKGGPGSGDVWVC